MDQQSSSQTAWLITPEPFIVYADSVDDARPIARQALAGACISVKPIHSSEWLLDLIPTFEELLNKRK